MREINLFIFIMFLFSCENIEKQKNYNDKLTEYSVEKLINHESDSALISNHKAVEFKGCSCGYFYYELNDSSYLIINKPDEVKYNDRVILSTRDVFLESTMIDNYCSDIRSSTIIIKDDKTGEITILNSDVKSYNSYYVDAFLEVNKCDSINIVINNIIIPLNKKDTIIINDIKSTGVDASNYPG